MEKNTSVYHSRFGRGVIQRSRYSGYEVLVRFENNMSLWLPSPELTPAKLKRKVISRQILEPPQKQSTSVKHAPAQVVNFPRVQNISRRKARNVIEAFRMGIIPGSAINEWTFGREQEVEGLEGWLHDPKIGAVLLVGEYGSGKTHLLEYLRIYAMDRGYATSYLPLDPNENPPGFPFRVYRSTVRNFGYKNQNRMGGFREFLTECVLNDHEGILSKHPYLGKVRELVRSRTDCEDMWHWIRGTRHYFPEGRILYDHTTAANIYCNLFSAIGWMAVNLLKLKGFLLLLDEAEMLDVRRYWYEYKRGLNFFKGLSMVSDDEELLIDEPVIKFDNYSIGKKSSLVFSGHIQLPYIFRISSHLKVVIALTPSRVVDTISVLTQAPSIELASLNESPLKEFFNKFFSMYIENYKLDIELPERRNLLNFLFSMNFTSTRMFVKALVEALDFKRYNPGMPFSTVFSEIMREQQDLPFY